jgi:hypothetical protein
MLHINQEHVIFMISVKEICESGQMQYWQSVAQMDMDGYT